MTTPFDWPGSASAPAPTPAPTSAPPSIFTATETATATVTADAHSNVPFPSAGVDSAPGDSHGLLHPTLHQALHQALHQDHPNHLQADSENYYRLHLSQPQPPTTSSSTASASLDRLPFDSHGEPESALLSFADIPSDLARLDYLPPHLPHESSLHSGTSPDRETASTQATATATKATKATKATTSTAQTAATSASTPSKPLPSLFHSLTPSRSSSRSSRRVTIASDATSGGSVSVRSDRSDHIESSPLPSSSPASSASATPAATSASSSVHHPLPRKPSPGLALRLKALGFGPATPKTSPPPAHPVHDIGRLSEDQLRQLEEKHQASTTAPAIERRGRPWKGAGAAVARGFRRSHSKQDASDAADADDSDPEQEADEQDHERRVAFALDPPTASFLPEIEAAAPLDMDTNKYRLPDHTNGNGTKVQLDTRKQHLERDSTLSLSAPESPDIPPPPLPKDTPPLPQAEQPPPPSSSSSSVAAPAFGTAAQQTEYTPDAVSYFNPLGLQRPGSIYTLSRVSFTNQLAQLTSLQLPDAESLSSKISAIPTAQAASRALIGAADQIRNWISKASEVIDGLDSDDDVEWAAAGGREGLAEVENAIARFEELINVYVSAIEELQSRPDIGNVTPEDLQRAVTQMEAIMDEWRRMRSTLQNVKAQVEIAMEWEELWGMVLGDIQNEMDELSRLVFEMEERRHRSIMASGASGDGSGVDIGDLETIVEESQQQQKQPSGASTRVQSAPGSNRYSIPVFPASPSSPDAESTTPAISQDDSSLLALFARMQPLRASLDFLPMRLSVFENRASNCFPTACEELETRREDLDATYKKLEKDAEWLRKELGEDRWVTVFRGAARQAQKMYESVERSVVKLRESLDAGMHLTNPPLMGKKIESYETKKLHYGPAIERVLTIIDKGVKDRLTLNGEILRLHAELQGQWDGLKDSMRELDSILEEMQADERRNQQLRDSISSMLSNDRSTIASAHDTPQSSPPSSVIMSSLGFDSGGKKFGSGSYADSKGTPTGNRRRSVMGSHLPQPTARRSVSSSASVAGTPNRKSVSRYSSFGAGTGSALSTPNRDGSVTPMGKRASMMAPRPSSVLDNRPRWNSSTNGVDTGHNFKPLTLTTPSPYAKSPINRRMASASTPGSGSSLSKLPMRSPLGRAGSSSPIQEDSLGDTPTRPRLLSNKSTGSSADSRRGSMQHTRPNQAAIGMVSRPASSMSMSRRTSLLPASRNKRDSSVSGRESPQAIAGARAAMRRKPEPIDERPRWRI